MRMKSASRMDMGRVVPVGGSSRAGRRRRSPRRTSTSRSTKPLDRAELVRDVEDRDAEGLGATPRAGAERFLGVDVYAGCRLVEDEEFRLAGERLRDEGALLLAAGEPLDRCGGVFLEPDAAIAASDDRLPVRPAERLSSPRRATRPAATTSFTLAGASIPSRARCAR